jgi:hypothetical protein
MSSNVRVDRGWDADCYDALQMMHVFYIGEGNVVRQVYRDSKGKWCEGDLDRENIVVAPYAMMCACFVEGSNRSMRVYVQMQDNSIQEFGFEGMLSLSLSTLWCRY